MLVDILVKIAPDVYKDYVKVNNKGEKQILVKCPNALYGTMMASLLYYQKFTARTGTSEENNAQFVFTSTIVKSHTNHQKNLTKSSSGYGEILRRYSKTAVES